MLIRLAIQQIFKPNLTLFNEILYTITTVVNPVTTTHYENSFKHPKWKLRIKK